MQRVFITGANRGIGLGLVRHYLMQGDEVIATYREPSSSEALFALRQDHPNLTLYALEVTDYPAVNQLAKKISGLDLLINNAGYYGPKGYGFGHADVEEWRKVFEINTIAPLKLVEALYPALKNSPAPRIACLSSKVGSMTENTSGGGYLYRSSKAALNSVIKSLHNDLHPQGFTVLALHPGWVQTRMGGENALINVEESVAGLVNVIAGAGEKQSGCFINYNGQPIPW